MRTIAIFTENLKLEKCDIAKTMKGQKREKGQERFFICTWQTEGKERELNKKLFQLFRGQWKTFEYPLNYINDKVLKLTSIFIKSSCMWGGDLLEYKNQ
jgi:hypothetical protein